MKNGFRVYDSDTHVMPAAEVLERYVDPGFRPRLAELAAYRAPIRQSAEHSGGGHAYRVNTKYYRRILVDAAVEEIREWGNSDWAVAVQPSLGQDIPADHPDLEPIWRAAAEHDLPIVHHSSTWNPPYYPGYRDVWDNIFIGRLASHPWGAMR